jgi:hypothetical protein
LAAAGGNVPFILDCIGSKDGSLKPLSEVAGKGSKVAVLLPVIVKDASETEAPEYSMDVAGSAPWKEGVDARGVRTHFYLDVSLLSPSISFSNVWVRKRLMKFGNRMNYSKRNCKAKSCLRFWNRAS